MSRRVALIGKPLRRRHSQVMHDAAFAAAGIDARYELREIDPEALSGFTAESRGAGWYGFQVTAPYKVAVMSLLDEVEPDARAIGAVNSVATAGGHHAGFNTDAPGFRRAVESLLGGSLRGIDAVVLGAGGVAHAIAYALLDARASRIVVANRDPIRAADLARHFAHDRLSPAALPEVAGQLADADLVVNATTVGMLSAGTPVPVEQLGAAAAVFDCVYVPSETPFVAGARARGLRASNGGEMLVAQAAIAFERWTGIGGMDEVMRTAVRPLLDDPAAQP